MVDAENGVLPSTSPALSIPQVSPVTWHVIIWLLLCLAINSMAQPSRICGIPSRFRLYLACSPIITLADAIIAFVVTIVLSVSFRLGPRTASHLFVISRLDELPSVTSNDSHGAPNRTWPRWLFFIMGPLPATIKIASFSGIPWTKAWGMIFASSFVVVELMSVPYRMLGAPETTALPDTLPTQTSRTDLAARSDRFIQILEASGYVLFCLALLIHVVILIWAIEVLWLQGVEKMAGSELGILLMALIRAIILTILVIEEFSFLIIGLVWLVMHSQRDRCKRLLWSLLKIGAWTFFFHSHLASKRPKKKEEEPFISAPPAWMDTWKTMFIVVYLLAALYWLFYQLSVWMCRRWPIVARALLIERKESVAPEDSQQPESPDIIQPDPFSFEAWASMCFFLTTLAVCVLWYAFKYDSAGSVNPPWTDVFGK